MGTSLTGGSNGEVTKHSPFRSLALAFALIVLTAVMPIAWPTSQRPARPQMLEDMTVTQVTTPTDWWAEHPQVKATVDAHHGIFNRWRSSDRSGSMTSMFASPFIPRDWAFVVGTVAMFAFNFVFATGAGWRALWAVLMFALNVAGLNYFAVHRSAKALPFSRGRRSAQCDRRVVQVGARPRQHA